MSDNKLPQFSFVRIITNEFAIIDENYSAEFRAQINVELNFNFSKEEKVIAVQSKITFLQEEKPFLITAITCMFLVEDDDWKKIYTPKDSKLILHLLPARHLSSLTIGTARGVIHAKTEHLPLNMIILPPINVQEMINNDIEMLSK